METAEPTNWSPPRLSGMAIASLITGIIGASPIAIILGHIALSRIKKSSDQLSGFGLALAGTIVGYVGMSWMLLLIFMPVLYIGDGQINADRNHCMLNTRNVQQAVRGHANMTSMNVGDPIEWDAIFGSNGYLKEPTCPLGGTYTFVDTIPPLGTLVGQCSHADHVPADHTDW